VRTYYKAVIAVGPLALYIKLNTSSPYRNPVEVLVSEL